MCILGSIWSCELQLARMQLTSEHAYLTTKREAIVSSILLHSQVIKYVCFLLVSIRNNIYLIIFVIIIEAETQQIGIGAVLANMNSFTEVS